MKYPISIIFLFLLVWQQGHTQAITPSVLNSSGGSYAQGIYSIDWSVGELSLVTTMKADAKNLVVTNGFFQPNAIWDKKWYEDNFTAAEITILPNPTYASFDVQFHTRQQGTITLIVYDVMGRELLRKKGVGYGTETTEKINLAAQPAGTFFLHIVLEPAPGSVAKRQTFKIVKA